MNPSQSSNRHSALLWFAAGVVANATLPWTLSRAARGAALRDCQDCHDRVVDAHRAA